MSLSAPLRALAPFTLLVLSGPPLPQEPYTFKVQVRNVYVDVFVSRNGKPMRDLRKDNFIVLDNGVRQDVQLIDVGSVPMSSMLVLDISGSVRGEKLRHLRAAAHAFVDGLKEEDEAGLLMFTHRLRLRKGLDSDFRLLDKALNQRLESGFTSLNDALFVALKLLERAKGRPLLLLFTDGVDNTSWIRDSEILKMARASETILYAVGARSMGGVYRGRRLVRRPTPRGRRILQRVAESTGGRLWFADSTAELKQIYLGILTEMETRYLLVYQPQGVSNDGWHGLEVRLRGAKASEVRARKGYLASGGG